mgnify:CR=1 FL=1
MVGCLLKVSLAGLLHAALVKRMYKHQETLATLLTGKKTIHLIFVLSAQIIPYSEGVIIINNNCCHIFILNLECQSGIRDISY